MIVQQLPKINRPRILVVLHQENSTPGRIGRALVARGFELDIRKPRFGDPLPTTMRDHEGAVIFGGPMSANSEEDFVKREIDWINVPLKEDKPFLGVCLGAQMMVRQLGGNVMPRPDGKVEIGYYPLTPTDEGSELMSWPEKVYQWHSEGFDLPSSCDRLAATETYPNQAIRYGKSAFGIQFHVELTHAMMVRWTTAGREGLCLPGARPRKEHFTDRFAYDAEVRLWLENFLDLWVGPGHQAHMDLSAAAE